MQHVVHLLEWSLVAVEHQAALDEFENAAELTWGDEIVSFCGLEKRGRDWGEGGGGKGGNEQSERWRESESTSCC